MMFILPETYIQNVNLQSFHPSKTILNVVVKEAAASILPFQSTDILVTHIIRMYPLYTTEDFRIGPVASMSSILCPEILVTYSAEVIEGHRRFRN
jgi:hypothetical protein